MLEDSCLSLADLVLLQTYVSSDLIPLKTSSKITTSSSTTVLSDDVGNESGVANASTLKSRQSTPNNTDSMSTSLNSETLSATELTLPHESDSATEKTGLSVPLRFVPRSVEQEGTGSVKASAVIASEFKLFSDGPSTLTLSQEVTFESKATDKFTLVDPENVNVTLNRDITLEKLEKNNISLQKPSSVEVEYDSPTACYKGH
jgi:hypothetical protein